MTAEITKLHPAGFDESLAVYETIGTCSICGGPVLSGMTRTTRRHRRDHCGACGAVPKGAHGPVIQMISPPAGEARTPIQEAAS